jgi:hypothetical protein
MDQSEPQSPETPQPPDEAWRRFTLLDLLILFTGHAAAISLMKWYAIFEEDTIRSILIVPMIQLVLFSLILGGILSVPMVVFVQFQSRHRQEEIKGGEYYAIGSCIFWVMTLVAEISLFNEILSAPLMVGSLIGFPIFFYGGCLFFMCIFKTDRKAPCKWLGVYGYFLCFLSAAFCLTSLIMLISAN